MRALRNFSRLVSYNPRPLFVVPNRNLHIHEYQGQQIFRKYGVNVPLGDVASTKEEAIKVVEQIGKICLDSFIKQIFILKKIKEGTIM